MREESQFKTAPTKRQRKEEEAQITPGKSYLGAISGFSQRKLTVLPGLDPVFPLPFPLPPQGAPSLFPIFLASSGSLSPGRPAWEGVCWDLGAATARSAPAEGPAGRGPPPRPRGGGGLPAGLSGPRLCPVPRSPSPALAGGKKLFQESDGGAAFREGRRE